jgi:Arc/MetJ-type ribon-helix-helix transcriptional regulator
LNISRPEPLQAFVEAQAKAGRDGCASGDIRTLVREDQKRQVQEQLEARLLEALESIK